jgi:hypothetical protein
MIEKQASSLIRQCAIIVSRCLKKSGKVRAYAGRNLCSLDLTYQFRYASPQVESNAFIFPAMSINGQSAFLVVLIENGVVNDSNWGVSRPAAFMFHPISSNGRNWVGSQPSAFDRQKANAAVQRAADSSSH